MATAYETIFIPAHEEKRAASLICDLCKTKSPTYPGWGVYSFDVERVTIEYESGHYFPEGGQTDTTSVDLCPDCFQSKLLPWLAEQGVRPTVTDSDE